nr:MAG TPA: hypothetical protein [Caudoviricetes sp.]
MSVIDKISSAVSEWGCKVASSFLPQVRIPQGSAVGKFMYGILGVDPATYSPWDELGFLAEPIIQNITAPMINKMFSGMTDEQMKDTVQKFVDSFIDKAKEKGYVNIFGVQLGEDAFEGLKEILNNKLK